MTIIARKRVHQQSGCTKGWAGGGHARPGSKNRAGAISSKPAWLSRQSARLLTLWSWVRAPRWVFSRVGFQTWSWLGGWSKMDTLGIEPRAFRMQSGCDTTTQCARHRFPHRRFACCMLGSPPGGATQATPRGFEPPRAEPNGFRVHLLSRSDTVSWQQSHAMHAKRCKTHIARNSATVILCGCQIGPTRA